MASLIDQLKDAMDPEKEEKALRETFTSKAYQSMLRARKVIDVYVDDPALSNNPEKVTKDLFFLAAILVRIGTVVGYWEAKTNDKVIRGALQITEAEIAQDIRRQHPPYENVSNEGRKLSEEGIKQLIAADPRYRQALEVIGRAQERVHILRQTADDIREFVWTLRDRGKGIRQQNRDGRGE